MMSANLNRMFLLRIQILLWSAAVSLWCRSSGRVNDDHTIQDELPPKIYYDKEAELNNPGKYCTSYALRSYALKNLELVMWLFRWHS